MRGFRSGGGVFLHVHALGCLFIFVCLRGCRYHRFFLPIGVDALVCFLLPLFTATSICYLTTLPYFTRL